MELSIFLAKFWGILLIVTIFPFVIKKDAYTRILKAMKHEGTLIVTGYISLVIGLLSVLLHNIWYGGWPIIITVFGWLALMKGLVRLIWPQFTQEAIEFFSQKTSRPWMIMILIVCLALGFYLLYMGMSLS